MAIATVIGIVAAITMLLMAMANPVVFFNLPSVLIVIGGMIALLLISFPLREVVRFFHYVGYAIIPPKPTDDRKELEEQLQTGILMFGRLKTYAQALGWIGFLIGLLLMLHSADLTNLDDIKDFGKAMPVALLTVLYSIILAYVFCLPLKTKLERQRDELQKA